jgi:serine/threonine protein kinase
MTLTTGTKLGPYEIVAPLGAGGMGEVYRARDTRLDRTVAIKILPASLSNNPDARQRFQREAKAISSLQHPNICTLYDIGSENDDRCRAGCKCEDERVSRPLLLRAPAAAARTIRGQIGRQNLDGYIPLQPRVAGTVYLAHAAGAQRRLDLIRPEFRARGEGHACASL